MRDDEKLALAEILDAVGPEDLRVYGVPGPQIIVDAVWQGWERELAHLPRFSACVDVAEPIDDEQLIIDRNDRAADLRHGEIIAQSHAGYVERQKRRVDVLIERDRHRSRFGAQMWKSCAKAARSWMKRNPYHIGPAHKVTLWIASEHCGIAFGIEIAALGSGMLRPGPTLIAQSLEPQSASQTTGNASNTVLTRAMFASISSEVSRST